MGIFYSATDKEILEARNKIFLDYGILEIEKNGFEKSPFSTAWFGKDDVGDYSYEFSRLTIKSELQILSVDIVKSDKWIKFSLNIFHLKPALDSIRQLNGMDGLKYNLPPISTTSMRLRIDDIKGVPLFKLLFNRQHKIGSYFSKEGFNKRVLELQGLVKDDLANIDSFVIRWHEIHKPFVTNWLGETIE